MRNQHGEMQFSKATMSRDKRVAWKSCERASTLHPLLYRVVLAPRLLNLRLLGAPPSTPLSLNVSGRKKQRAAPHLFRALETSKKHPTPFYLVALAYASRSKTIYQASCDESSDVFPAMHINMCSSPCNVWPQAAHAPSGHN